jgi:hypothetical protein
MKPIRWRGYCILCKSTWMSYVACIKNIHRRVLDFQLGFVALLQGNAEERASFLST